jgi:hypothetical protein
MVLSLEDVIYNVSNDIPLDPLVYDLYRVGIMEYAMDVKNNALLENTLSDYYESNIDSAHKHIFKRMLCYAVDQKLYGVIRNLFGKYIEHDKWAYFAAVRQDDYDILNMFHMQGYSLDAISSCDISLLIYPDKNEPLFLRLYKEGIKRDVPLRMAYTTINEHASLDLIKQLTDKDKAYLLLVTTCSTRPDTVEVFEYLKQFVFIGNSILSYTYSSGNIEIFKYGLDHEKKCKFGDLINIRSYQNFLQKSLFDKNREFTKLILTHDHFIQICHKNTQNINYATAFSIEVIRILTNQNDKELLDLAMKTFANKITLHKLDEIKFTESTSDGKTVTAYSDDELVDNFRRASSYWLRESILDEVFARKDDNIIARIILDGIAGNQHDHLQRQFIYKIFESQNLPAAKALCQVNKNGIKAILLECAVKYNQTDVIAFAFKYRFSSSLELIMSAIVSNCTSEFVSWLINKRKNIPISVVKILVFLAISRNRYSVVEFICKKYGQHYNETCPLTYTKLVNIGIITPTSNPSITSNAKTDKKLPWSYRKFLNHIGLTLEDFKKRIASRNPYIRCDNNHHPF